MKALRENPVLQFSLVSLVIVSLMVFLTGWQISNAIINFTLADVATQTANAVSRLVSQQVMPADFQKPMLGERYAAFNDYMQRYIVSDRIARIKLWSPEGVVIFSTDQSQLGLKLPIEAELAQALSGGISRGITTPQEAETEQERLLGTLLKVSAAVYEVDTDKVVGAFETYYYFASVAEQIRQHTSIVYRDTIIGGIVLYIILFLIVNGGWRQILSQRKEIDMRLREVGGLNNLFIRQLAERDHAIEILRKLSTEQVVVDVLNREEVITEYHRLKTEVQRLTAEISRPTTTDSSGT